MFLLHVAQDLFPGGSNPVAGSWLIPVSVILGGLLAGVLVYTLAPEAEGHGTDTVVDAFHNFAGRIRARVPLVKLVASAITIGSGGSAGREGPTALISGGIWKTWPKSPPSIAPTYRLGANTPPDPPDPMVSANVRILPKHSTSSRVAASCPLIAAWIHP